jgi:hypothetical protein
MTLTTGLELFCFLSLLYAHAHGTNRFDALFFFWKEIERARFLQRLTHTFGRKKRSCQHLPPILPSTAASGPSRYSVAFVAVPRCTARSIRPTLPRALSAPVLPTCSARAVGLLGAAVFPPLVI